MPDYTYHPASYKDPSGFIFQLSGIIYRQVNKQYAENYDLFVQCGLYDLLKNKKLLIPHQELRENKLNDEKWYLTLLPEQIPFWSYPYEWCFDQLKDAALLTLELIMLSIEKGMILKDATPFNIQFYRGKPVFIDTLSFEKYDASKPWIAYRQFCETFLYPLLLAHYHKMNFQNQLALYPDGIPVDITAKLLPAKSNLNTGVWLHVHLLNKISKRSRGGNSKAEFSKKKMQNLISHLQSIIQKLDNTHPSTWSNYYSETISGGEYANEKAKIINNMFLKIEGSSILDMGANDGHFSFLAAKNNYNVLAIDNDEQCINGLYKNIKKQQIHNILPLCIDISNPTSGSGFANEERNSFIERIQPDTVLALALIHHLVIAKNIPLRLIAEYFSKLSPQLIIEFIPKEDEKVQFLLENKEDIYLDYSQEKFEWLFLQFFKIEEKVQIKGSVRIIYLMKRINEL